MLKDNLNNSELNYSQNNENELNKIYSELGFTDIKFMVSPSNTVSYEMCVEHTLKILKDYRDEKKSGLYQKKGQSKFQSLVIK